MIQEASINRESVFLDMGSGIGNVVLQVAGLTGCESFGIEIMQNPANLAREQLKEFEKRAKYVKACC
jgi:H3 lysine-79-specific histone-lysine N-methyltransferase